LKFLKLFSKSWSSLPNKASLYEALPDSLKAEVLVRARVETPEIQAERAETVKTKTVAELSQINSISDFPLPKQIENLIHTDIKLDKLFERPGYCKNILYKFCFQFLDTQGSLLVRENKVF
jgi:hypothetical protein